MWALFNKYVFDRFAVGGAGAARPNNCKLNVRAALSVRVLELESISFTLKFNSQLPEGSSSCPSICCTYMVYMVVGCQKTEHTFVSL